MSNTLASPKFPTTLQTASSAEGHALARQLAALAFAEVDPQPATMAEMLRQPAGVPSSAVVSAVYFHAIAIANHGWRT